MASDPTPLPPPRLATCPLAKAAIICWTWAQTLRRTDGQFVHMREAALHTLANVALQTNHERIRKIAEDALKAAAAGGKA